MKYEDNPDNISCRLCGRHYKHHSAKCTVKTLAESGKVYFEIPDRTTQGFDLVIEFLNLAKELVAAGHLSHTIDAGSWEITIPDDLIDLRDFDGRNGGTVEIFNTPDAIRETVQRHFTNTKREYLIPELNASLDYRLRLAAEFTKELDRRLAIQLKSVTKNLLRELAQAAAKAEYKRVMAGDG